MDLLSLCHCIRAKQMKNKKNTLQHATYEGRVNEPSKSWALRALHPILLIKRDRMKRGDI